MKDSVLPKFKFLIKIVQNTIEVYIPVAAFILMFIVFLLQVTFRYIFNNPLTWTQDIIVFCFCWVVVLGASYTMRTQNHVLFTLVYDNLKPKFAAASRLAGSLIIMVTFILLLKPSYNYCQFLAFQRMAMIKISYYWVFLPFVYFVFSVIVYTIPYIVEDIQIITGKIEDSEDRKHSILKGVEK